MSYIRDLTVLSEAGTNIMPYSDKYVSHNACGATFYADNIQSSDDG